MKSTLSLTRDQIHKILVDWQEYVWQVQGFGMIRTYLYGYDEPRLQVWDQRLATLNNNAIHDHPWRFTSKIFAGMIFNQRYDVNFPIGRARNGWVNEITPGVQGGVSRESPIMSCSISPQPLEIYSAGESYSQTHREMHITRYLPGTVTLITRYDREPDDKAHVAWYGKINEQPQFVNPYPAEKEIVKTVITDALRSWWL